MIIGLRGRRRSRGRAGWFRRVGGMGVVRCGWGAGVHGGWDGVSLI